MQFVRAMSKSHRGQERAGTYSSQTDPNIKHVQKLG